MKSALSKNKTLLIVIGALLIAGLAFGAGMAIKSITATSDSYIGIEKAKTAALKDAGCSSSDAKFTLAKLDKEARVPSYIIKFKTKKHSYVYEIDAANGTVLDKLRKDIKATVDSDNNKKDGSGDDSGNSDGDTNENTDKNNGSNSNGNKSVNSYIGVAKAKSIALSHAGVSASAAYFTSAHLDSDDGIKCYEIEFSTNKGEYEYQINALTGHIMDYERDITDDNDDDDDDDDD